MIDVSFEFTKDELAEAQRRLVPALRILSIVFVLLAFFFLWLGYHDIIQANPSGKTQPRTINVAELIAASIPFAVYVGIYIPVWLNLRKRLKQQRENPMLTGPRRIFVDDSGIRTTHALSEAFYRWEAVEKVFVTKQLYLLRAWSIVLIIPKRVIRPEQVAQFELLLRSRVMERTGGFPVRATPPPLPASNTQQGQA